MERGSAVSAPYSNIYIFLMICLNNLEIVITPHIFSYISSGVLYSDCAMPCMIYVFAQGCRLCFCRSYAILFSVQIIHNNLQRLFHILPFNGLPDFLFKFLPFTFNSTKHTGVKRSFPMVIISRLCDPYPKESFTDMHCIQCFEPFCCGQSAGTIHSPTRFFNPRVQRISCNKNNTGFGGCRPCSIPSTVRPEIPSISPILAVLYPSTWRADLNNAE